MKSDVRLAVPFIFAIIFLLVLTILSQRHEQWTERDGYIYWHHPSRGMREHVISVNSDSLFVLEKTEAVRTAASRTYTILGFIEEYRNMQENQKNISKIAPIHGRAQSTISKSVRDSLRIKKYEQITFLR